MNAAAAKFMESVPWDQLQHAYGAAGDLPPLLESVASASGRKLDEALSELCSRVLHQGTIYSASPPAVRILIEILPGSPAEKRAHLYRLLDAFVDSARMAIEDGPAPPCHAGGDPADGKAIRRELADAHGLFEADLAHSGAGIRGYAANLLAFLAGEDATAAEFVRSAYAAETESSVRYTMLAGLALLPNAFQDSLDFWNGALRRETDPINRFVIRRLEVAMRADASDQASVEDLVSCFVKVRDSNHWVGSSEKRFFQAIERLVPEREVAALLQALNLAREDDLTRILAEHLLRRVFGDQRTGWGKTSSSRLREDGSLPPQQGMYQLALRSIGMLILFKLFPFARSWYVRRLARRKPKGIRKIEYWGLQGAAPEIPAQLTGPQRAVLTSVARKSELWRFRTNLWTLFNLPDSAVGLRQFVAQH